MMSTNAALNQLRMLHTDLSLTGGNPRACDAINVAIGALVERKQYDWLSASTAREELTRMKTQLAALGQLLENMADTLERVLPYAPKGHYLDSMQRHQEQLNAVMDSIIHDSTYRREA